MSEEAQPKDQPLKPAAQESAAAQEKPVEAKPAAQEKPIAAKPATAENAKAEAAPKAEKQTNCPVCNKPIKRLTRYYRDGKFYCAKKCWRTAKEKAKSEKEADKK